MKLKPVLWLIVALAVLAAVVPYLPTDVLRPGIERALERGLGRKVEVGGIRLTLFPGPVPRPGFTLERVTIHEDPRAGIEPLAYVESLGASVRFLSLFQRKLEFASLNLNDATINMVKTDAGPWNFQFLLENGPANSKRIPAIRMRAGRVNFKFGDTKSVFYFNDADLDVTPSSDGSMELRFGGAPSRTDRSTQEFGRFFVRGTAAPESRRLDLKVELERSPLAETLRWMDPRGFDVHGTVALDAQLSGPPSHLDVAGKIQLADVHRWDLVPNEVGGLKLGFGGALDLGGERLDLQTTADRSVSPMVIRFRSWDFLKSPHWDAGVDLQQVPLATMLAVCRHMGATLPENLAAQGSVSGSVTYNEPQGMQGRVVVRDASLSVPAAETDAAPVEAAVATLDIAGRSISLESASVHIGEKQSAEIEGSYDLDQPRSLDLKITTRGLSVAAMRSFGLEAIPLLDQTPQGTWRGWARYQGGDWSGESELQNARIALDGLAEPLVIKSASVSLNGKRVAVSRLQAKAGSIAFTGSYRWEPGSERSDKFDLKIDEADIAELSRLFAPALLRDRGFLARTLRLGGNAPVPAWLKAIQTEGAVSIGSLTAGDLRLHAITAQVKWNGPMAQFTDLTGLSDPAEFAGDLSVDLGTGTPHYHFDGKVTDIAYKGGELDLEGTLDAEGEGSDLFENARAEGTLRGRAILFAPDTEFRTVAARFEMQGGGAASRWKLSNVEVNQSGESLAGTGASQADGRLVLELVSRGRPLRYTGTLFTMAGPP
ncbi:MAG: AsmA family protein [Acidobacteriia bacterium]|nr:AsmA family protein [Terriglobia bacterium]